MASDSSRRFHLIDLVMAVLFCGLVAATFSSRWGFDKSNGTFIAAGAVAASWYYLRYVRAAPICADCGARFFPANSPADATECPHCGEPQPRLRQALVRPSIVLCVTCLLMAISVMAAIAFAVDPSRASAPFSPGRLAALLIALSSAALCVLSIAWLFVSRSQKATAGGRVCDACGQPVNANQPAPSICPNCRSRKLNLDEFKQQQSKSNRSLLLVTVIVAMLGVSCLCWFVPSMFRAGNWLGLLVVGSLSGSLLFYAWKLARFLIQSRRLSGLLGEEETLAKARACAGEEGTIARTGETTIWYSGPDDPAPMLREELVAAHRRVESLLGETSIPDRPLRILCFHDRHALQKLYKTLLPHVDLSAHLGIFLQRPWNVMTLCTSPVLGRLEDPRSVAGSLYCVVLLEQSLGRLPVPWLHAGIAGALAVDRSRRTLIGLNRRMLTALADGIDWSEDMFITSATKLSKRLLRTNDPQSARKSEQFADQAWSIVEYLAGDQAPEPRKAAFRALLKDKRPPRRAEEAFFRHFGFGFGSLLDSWRQWVTDQGPGPDEPPTPDLRDALVKRVLPVIRDPLAPRGDRTQAIRNWKRAGTTFGADTLIDLLRNLGEINKEEIVWSLKAASAMPWGDDPDRWQAWWENSSTDPVA